MRPLAILFASCTLLAAVRDSAAQSAPPAGARRFAYTVGLSKGAGALTCRFCSGEARNGVAGMIGVETRFRPPVRLGIEGDWWIHSSDGSTRTVLAAIPVVIFSRTPSSPVFFKFGLGVGRFSASSDEEELRTSAIAAVVGAGYEFRMANRNVLVPYVSWVSGGRGTMRLNGAQVTGAGGLSLLQYGLAFSKR
jgi:hypothetical protein